MTSALVYDLVVIGGGAAGLMCASVAGQRGLRVLLIDHSKSQIFKLDFILKQRMCSDQDL